MNRYNICLNGWVSYMDGWVLYTDGCNTFGWLCDQLVDENRESKPNRIKNQIENRIEIRVVSSVT